MSPTDISQKLRQMGLVIRFFGESNTSRFQRLQQALEQQSQVLQNLSILE
jgi:hypothetical protein